MNLGTRGNIPRIPVALALSILQRRAALSCVTEHPPRVLWPGSKQFFPGKQITRKFVNDNDGLLFSGSNTVYKDTEGADLRGPRHAWSAAAGGR